MDLLASAPRLHLLGFRVGQARLGRDGEDLTLIDTGPAGCAPAIAAAVQCLGTLERVVLTHFHHDHTGSAAEIGAWPGVTVLAHGADAPIIRGERPGPPPDFSEAEVPGHADGSIALHLTDRALLTGDVIAEHGGERMLGPFNLDRARAAASMRLPAALDVDIACFGHGDALVGGAGERLRHLHG